MSAGSNERREPFGEAFLLKLGNGSTPPQYSTIAGLRVVKMTSGPSGMDIRASGIFISAAAASTILTRALDRKADDYELSFEDGVKLRGKFLIRRLCFAGQMNGEARYTVEIESDGEVTVQ